MTPLLHPGRTTERADHVLTRLEVFKISSAQASVCCSDERHGLITGGYMVTFYRCLYSIVSNLAHEGLDFLSTEWDDLVSDSGEDHDRLMIELLKTGSARGSCYH
jgi:hypothetical protein